jgi:hypothetical protein
MHEEISWVSCKYHWCEKHEQDKRDNDCFPVAIPGTPNDRPYRAEETEGYETYKWYENLGVAELRFSLAYYRQITLTKELCTEMQRAMIIVEDSRETFRNMIGDKYLESGIRPQDDPEEKQRDEELRSRWQQQLHNDEHVNNCSDGEGCNKSECELTHRDASGNETRHL